jgi:type I restriction enzyme R subunit
LSDETLRSFRSSYIEAAKQFREIQQKESDKAPVEVQQLDFEFVLFSPALIDYDYIMELIADSTQKKPSKQKMTKSQIINLL